MRFTITIDIPDDALAKLVRIGLPIEQEWADTRFARHPITQGMVRDITAAITGQPPDPGDEPPNVQAEDAPPAPADGHGPPRTGRQLMAWIRRQPDAVFQRARAVCRSWKYAGRILDLEDEQAVALYEELTRRPERRASR